MIPTALTVMAAETNAAAAALGLGLIQVPRYRVARELAAGELIEVLGDFPPSPSPVYVLYPHSRQLSPRVRVFIDWIAGEFARACRLGPSRGAYPSPLGERSG